MQISQLKNTPALPVGPALGQAGINIIWDTQKSSARTADQAGI